MNSNHQIIKDNNELNNDIDNIINSLEDKNTKDYYTLGIIGGQSTGKSTLLNCLFNTNFYVMDSKIKRQQTTKGIWLNYKKKEKLIILDIEGADSKERWENKEVIEKSTALFGLIMSNLLIINIWLHDVGRFSSSNYNILKTIIEINLQLFKKDSLKKIMFIIRDFDNNENFENIKNTITNDIKKLWLEINKPTECENLNFDEIIKLDFAKISNFIYEKEKFKEDVDSLRNRFLSKINVNYAFNDISNESNSLFGDLPILMKRVYDLIKNNKEINLPDQKVMISNYRCGEIKNNILEIIEEQLEELDDLIINDPTKGSEKLNFLIDNAINNFDRDTINYDKEIISQTKLELNDQINLKLDEIFKKVNNLKIKELMNNFDKEIIEYSKEQDILKKLKNIKNLKFESLKWYEEFLKPFKKENCLNNNLKQFSNEIEIKVFKTISDKLNSFLRKIQNDNYKKLDNTICKFFKIFTIEYYEIFKEEFNKIFDEYENDIEKLKKELNEMKSLIKNDYLIELKKNLFIIIKSQISKKLENGHKYLIEIFKNKFENDESKMRRNWKSMSDADIENLFKDTKNSMKESIDLIKSFTIPQLKDPNISDKNITIDENLLNEEDFSKVLENFDTGINNILERAFSKKYDRNSFDRIPKWFWFIFIYAIHDNILNWVNNPFLLFLLIVFAGLFGYLSATGKLYLFVNFIKLFKQYVLNKKDPIMSDSVKKK